jgi:hypothetical protein
VNSLTLNGSFKVADCFANTNQAKILLNAFNASTTAGARVHARKISRSQLHSVLAQMGMHSR